MHLKDPACQMGSLRACRLLQFDIVRNAALAQIRKTTDCRSAVGQPSEMGPHMPTYRY